MVKKGGSVPPGNINEWFWEKGNMRSTISAMLPDGASPLIAFERYGTDTMASTWWSLCRSQLSLRFCTGISMTMPGVGLGVKCGLDTFKRYPENLLNSRSRYVRAFQVGRCLHIHALHHPPCCDCCMQVC